MTATGVQPVDRSLQLRDAITWLFLSMVMLVAITTPTSESDAKGEFICDSLIATAKETFVLVGCAKGLLSVLRSAFKYGFSIFHHDEGAGRSRFYCLTEEVFEVNTAYRFI